jgi:hypothetical protein
MWDIPPAMLCRKHLLGEHVEMHMFAGSIEKGKNIDGYICRGLVQTDKIAKRHDILAAEMTLRGMKHASPLKQPIVESRGKVDPNESYYTLGKRCKECESRIIAVTARLTSQEHLSIQGFKTDDNGGRHHAL